ncbi:MAG TPA: restriction endonuclease [Lentisphaeria bacterium]|nr:restriction endonuclease [Lentisphaeria bacterium]
MAFYTVLKTNLSTILQQWVLRLADIYGSGYTWKLIIPACNALLDQTRRGDFRHFKDKMTVVKNRMADKAYEIYLALYQGLTGIDEEKNIYKNFSPDFFDLIVVDECHRGSAADDNAWKNILKYYKSATQIGLTATPRETKEISNIEYFGDPIYTYSLKQGISDGFLAPYRVIRVGFDVDLEGWRPEAGFTDKDGKTVEDRIYNRSDYDKNLVIEERRKKVAAKITEFLKGTDRFSKTIVFCRDIEHAEAMRREISNQNADLVKANHKYVMRITGDDSEGKKELDNFIDPEMRYPVIATTSKLMTTGVDAQTCKLIVLDSNIRSMTEFKQIIGRGTRILEEYGKRYFTILDFRNVTDLFADTDFDGEPVRIKEVSSDADISSIENEELENPETLLDEESGEEVAGFGDNIGNQYPQAGDVPPTIPPMVRESREKIYVNGVDVSILNERQMYFDQDGRPITMSLKDYTRQRLLGEYTTLDDFLQKWLDSDRKEAIVRELEEHGVPVDELLKAVNRNCDLFDIICHVAYDTPPLTRKERAENVRKRNYFMKYGEKSRKVLEALVEKYADQGIEHIEDIGILRIQPFSDFGTPMQIIEEFGGKAGYLDAVRELEGEIYSTLTG